jgi:hypothetical protein
MKQLISFQNHMRNCPLPRVAQREMSALAAKPRGKLRRFALEFQVRTLRR